MHGQIVESGAPGTRVALNVSGVDVDEVARGFWIGAPGSLPVTRLADVSLRVLPRAASPLDHDMEVIVHSGAGHVTARLRLIGSNAVGPGQCGFGQLVLSQPTCLAFGDRFVLRRPSPPTTLAGGRVLDPKPRRRWPRFKDSVAAFETLASDDAESRILVALDRRGFVPATNLSFAETGLTADERDRRLQALAAKGMAKAFGDAWITSGRYDRLRQRAVEILGRHHARFPLRLGAPREELRNRLGLSAHHFGAWLEAAITEGWLCKDDALIRLPDHAPELESALEAKAALIVERFLNGGTQPPSLDEARSLLGAEGVAFLLQRGDLVAVTEDVAFHRETYAAMLELLSSQLAASDGLSVAEIRDALDTSRKYVLALLEHTDRERITRRSGDLRVAGRGRTEI